MIDIYGLSQIILVLVTEGKLQDNSALPLVSVLHRVRDSVDPTEIRDQKKFGSPASLSGF